MVVRIPDDYPSVSAAVAEIRANLPEWFTGEIRAQQITPESHGVLRKLLGLPPLGEAWSVESVMEIPPRAEWHGP